MHIVVGSRLLMPASARHCDQQPYHLWQEAVAGSIAVSQFKLGWLGDAFTDTRPFEFTRLI
jgi:hypothetical protein